jgi:hypothetical protein
VQKVKSDSFALALDLDRDCSPAAEKPKTTIKSKPEPVGLVATINKINRALFCFSFPSGTSPCELT